MKVLVTGAAGFLGSRVVACLRAGHHEVVALRRSGPPDTELIDCEFADRARLAEILHSHHPEAVIHLAWYATPPSYWSAPENLACVADSMALLELARAAGCRRFVGAGTCAEYDWSYERLVENVTPCLPRTLYGAAKLAVCTVGERFAPLSFAWARYGFLFGSRDGRLISSAIEALSAGRDFPCSSGEQVRDFIHVDDAAAATVALVLSDVTGPINIGSGEPTSVRAVVESIAQLAGGTGRPLFGAVAARPDEPRALVLDLARLTTEVGWRPAHTLRERIASMVQPG